METQVRTPSVRPGNIAAFRRFNRCHTQRIQTLDEGLLNTEFNLAEARILYELANREKPKAKQIAEELNLDPAYLSRILRKFESEKLLKRTTSRQDNRCADLTLTAKGRAAFERLNALSDRQAHGILESLPAAEQIRMIAAMKTIEDIFSRRTDSPSYILRPHRVGDMGWVVSREGMVYAEEYGWDGTFEVLVARIVADFVENFDPVRERCWIAEMDGRSVGHIFLVKHPQDAHTAKLRLLMVEPDARGMGLGDALVAECIRFAKEAGYRKVTLWTQSILVAAHRIYKRAGFHLVREEPHHSFGKDLIGQTWELELG